MPTYEFHCEKCNKAFELVLTISEYEKQKKFRCPKCKSTRGETTNLVVSGGDIQKELMPESRRLSSPLSYGGKTG